jgi:hypothetical protein
MHGTCVKKGGKSEIHCYYLYLPKNQFLHTFERKLLHNFLNKSHEYYTVIRNLLTPALHFHILKNVFTITTLLYAQSDAVFTNNAVEINI